MPISRNRKRKAKNTVVLGGVKMNVQIIRTEPAKLLVGSYLTAKGLKLKAMGALKENYNRYSKNRYVDNPESNPVRLGINAKLKKVYHFT